MPGVAEGGAFLLAVPPAAGSPPRKELKTAGSVAGAASPAPGLGGTPRGAVAHVPDPLPFLGRGKEQSAAAGARASPGPGAEAPGWRGSPSRRSALRARRASAGSPALLASVLFAAAVPRAAEAARVPERERDWAGGLPALVLHKMFEHLRASGCDSDSLRGLYAAAGACRSWRAAAQGAFLAPHRLRRVEAEGFMHASQLLATAEASGAKLLKCHVVRQKCGLGFQRYTLWSGPQPSPGNKLLLVGGHQVVGTKSWSRVFLHQQGRRNGEALLTLCSSITGNRFTGKIHEEALQRADSAGLAPPCRLAVLEDIKFFYNLTTTLNTVGNGPRKIAISLRPETTAPPSTTNATGGCCGRGALPRSVVLKNKPPRWHYQLECWCLDFHGRIKQASVKNIQLIEEGTDDRLSEEVLMQFGKFAADIFTLDFNPTRLSALNAFAIALSTFNSHATLEMSGP